MNKTQRNEMALMKELTVCKVITVEDAINLLGVSESTVRRLFLSLEQKGTCVRGHGCLRVLDNDFVNIYTYEHAENTGVVKKEAIAQKALELIENGDVIYLDSGTTIAKLSTKLAQAIQDGRLRDVTVFTNSLVNLNLLKDYVTVHVIGGEYRDHRKDFCGMIAEAAVKSFCYNKCFLGTDGYKQGFGFTATDFQSAGVIQAVIANSGQRYILADDRKFKKTAVVQFAAEQDITAIVTDNPQALEALTDIRVI